MSRIRELRSRARRSRRDGFATPIVATMDEAQALSREMAQELATASPDQALLCLASLTEIQAALEALIARLQADMSETRAQIEAVRKGSRACVSYGATAGLAPARRGGR
jgi:predicted  nucleic acid-binding Zn-ribbon protein